MSCRLLCSRGGERGGLRRRKVMLGDGVGVGEFWGSWGGGWV